MALLEATNLEQGALVVQAVIAACAVWVAHLGLQTWRHQLYGTVEYDHARRLYRAVLELRESLTAVRAPFISGGEIAMAFSEAGVEPTHDGSNSDPRTDGLVYQRRWSAVQKARVTLQAELLEAEALWGAGVAETVRPLFTCVGELYAATMWHIRESTPENRRRTRQPSESALRHGEKMRDVLYSTGSDDDEYAKRLTWAVAGMETMLTPHLRSRSPRAASKPGLLLTRRPPYSDQDNP